MKYFTSFYWQQEEPAATSLMLQHFVYRKNKEPGVFTCVCTGQPEAHNHFTKGLTRWFQTRGREIFKGDTGEEPNKTKKSLEGIMRQLAEEIEDWETGRRQPYSENSDVIGLICCEERFLLFSKGANKAYLLNRRFGQSHSKQLMPGISVEGLLCNRETGLQLVSGIMEEGVALLLATPDFCDKLTEEQLEECLSVQEMTGTEKVKGRLRELGEEATRRGGKHMGAVLLLTGEGNEKQSHGKQAGKKQSDRIQLGRKQEARTHTNSNTTKEKQAVVGRQCLKPEKENGHNTAAQYREPKPEMTAARRKELEQHGYTMPIYLGRGATSEVWRVFHVATKTHMTCKISRQSNRAHREASLLEAVEHPTFPGFKSAWSGQGDSFLVMEYVPGTNLEKMVCRRGRLCWRQAVPIAMELAEGLVYLHERPHPVLFRDIKPDNVIIRQDGRVKLIDFGCACFEGETLSVAGNRGYSAPEQFERESYPGVESDVYALGKLLRFMLTGQHQNWRGVPWGLRCLVSKAVRGERRDRVPDMRNFLEQLAVYDGKHPAMRRKAEWLSLMRREQKADFYYLQKVQRGTDWKEYF